MSSRMTTGLVRFSFLNVFQPRAVQEGQEPKYSITMLIPKSDVKTKADVDNAINFVINENLQTKFKGVRPPASKLSLHDGDGVRPNGMPFGEECKGCWVITASSKQRPGVVDANCQNIIDESQIFSGCYGRVALNFFAYDAAGSRGVGCGLQHVQKLQDGEPLGNRISAEEAFGAQPQQQAQQYAPQPQYAQSQPQQYAPQTVQQAQPPWATSQYGASQPIDPITGKPQAIFGLGDN